MRKLAIVGSHPNGRLDAPYDNPDWEIWMFNEAPQWTGKRWDGCLQLHRPEIYSSPTNFASRLRKIDYWSWLQEDHGPDKRIWTYPQDSRIPNSVEYPLEEILKIVPYRYLRSSPAEALALGIYLGYTTIGLWGAELTSNTEYAYQAPNMTFWIGYAHGRGIDFQLHCWQSEFTQKIYGIEGELRLEPSYYASRANDFEKAAYENNKAFTRNKDKLNTAMMEAKFMEVANLIVATNNAAKLAGATDGGLEEARRYAGREDIIPRQEFEYQAAKAQQEAMTAEPEAHKAGGKTEYVWNVWKQTGRLDALSQLRIFLKEEQELSYRLGKLEGIYKENLTYIEEYDRRVEAAGGVRALEAVAQAA